MPPPPVADVADTDEPLARVVGRQLARARGDRSLREFAAAHGINFVTIHQLEQGKDNPTLARLERMAELYGVTITIHIDPR